MKDIKEKIFAAFLLVLLFAVVAYAGNKPVYNPLSDNFDYVSDGIFSGNVTSSGFWLADRLRGMSSSATSNALGFYTNGGEKLTILQNGNVGIGTNYPNSLLEVNGNSQFNGAIKLSNSTNSCTGVGPEICYNGTGIIIRG